MFMKSNKNKQLGYIDESGVPGLAIDQNDYFLVSLVIADSENSAEDIRHKIEQLRIQLKLPEDYEFHNSRNSSRVQKAFVKLMPNLHFHFITIALKKSNRRNAVTYHRAVIKLVEKLKDFDISNIEMDSNPILYSELKKEIRNRKIKINKIRQRNSKSSRLIQLADYVVSLSSKRVKKSSRSIDQFELIRKKCIEFIVE